MNKADYNELGSFATPSALIGNSGMKGGESYQDLDFQERKAFTREDFRVMINRTFMEFYGKFKDQFNPDEYMQSVDNDELVKRFNSFLEHSEENMLTMVNMPTLDLGNIPTTHSFMRSESQ